MLASRLRIVSGPGSVSEDWYDANWTRRQEITITEQSGSELTNYQVEIPITYDADMQADFDDIRFTDSDGLTLLDHWLETKVDSTSATFWVKVPTIPSSSTATIYMYYGNAGAASTSDIQTTFIDGDDFNRVGLNETQPWTKDANNPLTAYGFGDPFVWFESGTFYIFAYDTSNTNIVLFTAPEANPHSLTNQGAILDVGAGGAWDDAKVGDPHIVKVGSTYHMFYMGASGTGVTGIKIGHATASAIDGPYTKDGSNPVFSKASNGTNEPSVTHDGSTFHMLYTYATTGSTTDVHHKNIGYATSSDGTSWSDQGQVLSGTIPHNGVAVFGGDQNQIQDSDGIWHMFLNDGGHPIDQDAEMYQSIAGDLGGPWSLPSRGGTIDRGGSYDVIAPWSPSVVEVSGTYYMYYQAQDATGARLALATSSTLSSLYRLWQEDDFTGAFTISSNRLFKTSGDASWNKAESLGPLSDPPYVIEADIEFSAYSGSGDGYGVYIADNSSVNWVVIFNLNLNQMRLWEQGVAIHDTNTSHTLATGANGYKIRAAVTATGINFDWFDGSSWNNDALTVTGESFINAACGFYGFGDSANQFYGDDFRVREYASSEPTVAFGSEESV